MSKRRPAQLRKKKLGRIVRADEYRHQADHDHFITSNVEDPMRQPGFKTAMLAKGALPQAWVYSIDEDGEGNVAFVRPESGNAKFRESVFALASATPNTQALVILNRAEGQVLLGSNEAIPCLVVEVIFPCGDRRLYAMHLDGDEQAKLRPLTKMNVGPVGQA